MRFRIGVALIFSTAISRNCEFCRKLPLGVKRLELVSYRTVEAYRATQMLMAGYGKNRIYTLEKQVNHPEGYPGEDVESAPLLDSSLDTDAIFRKVLDGELEKICTFYQSKEPELYNELADVSKDVETYIEDTTAVNVDSLEEPVGKTRSLSLGTRPRAGSSLRNLG